MIDVYVDEIIKYIVEQVSYELTDTLRIEQPNITGVYFQHGHPLEVIAELQKLSQGTTTKNQRYPLVALFRDFPEEKGTGNGIYSEVTLNMIIAVRTEPTYTSDKRKEKSFLPILYPIYNRLMELITKSPKFMKPQGQTGMLKHTKIDHYFWGRESVYGADANIFQDWIDCIEIKNLKIKVKDIKC